MTRGRRIHGSDIRDIVWLRPDGEEMSDDEWNDGLVRCLGMLLNGQAMNESDERGRRVYDDVLLLLFNAYHEKLDFVIPQAVENLPWEVLIDTTWHEPAIFPSLLSGQTYPLQGRSLAVLMQPCR